MLYMKRAMIVHGVSAEEWAERHALLPFSHPCDDCGKPRETTLPFAHGPMRGLMAPPCSCGKVDGPYVYASGTPGEDVLAALKRMPESKP